MCTVSLIARQRGYLLAMNRDEKLTCASGLPPEIISTGGHQVVRPSEPGGGTWIALNDAGVTFALINWYSVKAQVKGNPVSRGEVVNSVGAQISPVASFSYSGARPVRDLHAPRGCGGGELH